MSHTDEILDAIKHLLRQGGEGSQSSQGVSRTVALPWIGPFLRSSEESEWGI